jgi:hypothetical protein
MFRLVELLIRQYSYDHLNWYETHIVAEVDARVI